MVALRVHRADLHTSAPSFQVYRAQLAGSAVTVPSLRVHRAAIAGSTSVILRTPATQNEEPESIVSVSVVFDPAGNTPDAWTWRVISGTAPSLSPTGGTATFVTPSTMPPGTTVVLGIKASSGGGPDSAEVTATITVNPQTEWSRAADGVWRGAALGITPPPVGGNYPAAFDTDGVPYFGEGLTSGVYVGLDTDGVPYFDAPVGSSIPVAFDTDGVPYFVI